MLQLKADKQDVDASKESIEKMQEETHKILGNKK